jgi:hypothetical protein
MKIKRFVDEMPENNTDILVCFNEDVVFSNSSLNSYRFCDDFLLKDENHNHNHDLKIEGDVVIVHPLAIKYADSKWDDLKNGYWISQRDCLFYLT